MGKRNIRKKKRLHEKLAEYLDDNGILLQWFANQIGMSRACLYVILNKEKVFKVKHFAKIIEKSKNTITLTDLFEDYLKQQGTDRDWQFEVKENRDNPLECTVSLKKINMNM